MGEGVVWMCLSLDSLHECSLAHIKPPDVIANPERTLLER
jgi:hypothetical protein